MENGDLDMAEYCAIAAYKLGHPLTVLKRKWANLVIGRLRIPEPDQRTCAFHIFDVSETDARQISQRSIGSRDADEKPLLQLLHIRAVVWH